ncbi:MAG TPA: YbaN family protein [Bacteroidales bacterium]|nr:YbaN family protein [Bacteroidales bacterium]
MIKILLISGGTISLLLGLIGIFIPVLPTTPFVLLSAGLYVRSSPALYKKIINSRITSRYLIRGTGRMAGLWALVIMWTMIALTALFVVEETWLIILLVITGITGTVFKINYFFRNRNH